MISRSFDPVSSMGEPIPISRQFKDNMVNICSFLLQDHHSLQFNIKSGDALAHGGRMEPEVNCLPVPGVHDENTEGGPVRDSAGGAVSGESPVYWFSEVLFP